MSENGGAITWRTEQRRIGDLVEWDRNPRDLTEKRAEDLRRSLEKFGYVEEIVLNADGRSMIGGHQRRRVLLAQAMLDPDAMVDVRIPSRPLTAEEAEELAIRLNKNTGSWDFDALANAFDEDALRAWGFTPFDFGKVAWPEPKAVTEEPDQPQQRPQAQALFSPVAVAELKDHPQNYREHPDEQVDHIVASIQQFGVFKNVVVARDGTILAGHGVVKAARKMGLATLPAIRLNLDPQDPLALKVLAAENEVSNLAIVDDRALTEMLKTILETDNLQGTGFTDQSLSALVMVTRNRGEIRDHDEANHWVGMPEAGEGSQSIMLMVYFDTHEGRNEFIEVSGLDRKRIQKNKETDNRWSTKWPQEDKDDLISVRMVEAEAGG